MKATKSLLFSIIVTTILTCSSICVYAMERADSWQIQTRQGETVTFKFLSVDEFARNFASVAHVMADAFSEVYPEDGLNLFLKQQFLKASETEFDLVESFLGWFQKTKIQNWEWFTSGIEVLDLRCEDGSQFVPERILSQIDRHEAERFLDSWIQYFKDNTTKESTIRLLAEESTAIVESSRKRHLERYASPVVMYLLKTGFENKIFFPCVAFMDEQPVGAALFFTRFFPEFDGSIVKLGDGELYLQHLGVSPSAQRRGLSRQLIFGITRLFQNLKYITLDTDKVNDINACQVYDHLDFRPYEDKRIVSFPHTQCFKWINWKNVIPAQIGYSVETDDVVAAGDVSDD